MNRRLAILTIGAMVLGFRHPSFAHEENNHGRPPERGGGEFHGPEGGRAPEHVPPPGQPVQPRSYAPPERQFVPPRGNVPERFPGPEERRFPEHRPGEPQRWNGPEHRPGEPQRWNGPEYRSGGPERWRGPEHTWNRGWDRYHFYGPWFWAGPALIFLWIGDSYVETPVYWDPDTGLYYWQDAYGTHWLD